MIASLYDALVQGVSSPVPLWYMLVGSGVGGVISRFLSDSLRRRQASSPAPVCDGMMGVTVGWEKGASAESVRLRLEALDNFYADMRAISVATGSDDEVSNGGE